MLADKHVVESKGAMRVSRLCSLTLFILALPAGVARSDAQPTQDYASLGAEVVEIVRDHFFDAEKAEAWAEQNAGYAAQVEDGARFARETNEVLAHLETSHTHYYPVGSVAYWGVLSIFGASLGIEDASYVGIGVDVDPRRFVRRVFAGSPAESGGLLRGDRIVNVNDRPFQPVGTFDGMEGAEVPLEIERTPDGPLLRLTVVPRRIDPRQEWIEALDEGARMISRREANVLYVPMPWCVGEEVARLMDEMIAERFGDAEAMVLDFRDGWGGCNPDFVNRFNAAIPVLTLIDREGESRVYDPQWRKPLYLLINGGSRSGKEVVAYGIKQQRRGTLVGTRTAGFVVGGRPFLLSDRSLLYVATMDARVDGKRLEGVGVAPDVVVADGLEHAAGADPQLERAVELAVEQARQSPTGN